MATGAVGGVASGQASRATGNVLAGQDIGSGLGNPMDLLVDGALGGLTSYVGYEAGRLIRSTGPYGTIKGHHIHAKNAFRGNPAYSADDAISVSGQYMTNRGWKHSQMTGAQHSRFSKFAKSGSPNTMFAHNRIAYNALRAGKASPLASWYLVQQSRYNLVFCQIYFLNVKKLKTEHFKLCQRTIFFSSKSNSQL